MRKYIFEAHAALKKVYKEGSYSDEALGRGKVSALATKLVYGVLENDVRLEYIISSLAPKRPKPDTVILLKIGAYALENLSDLPKYAIVSECVEVAKSLNDVRGASGFVNAVLKKIADGNYRLPKKTDKEYKSVLFSKPAWFIDRLEREYGEEVANRVLKEKPFELTHLRVREGTSLEYVKTILDKAGEEYLESEVGGLCVKISESVKSLFAKGIVTYQSPSSMLAVRALAPFDGDALDLCAAPGGKSVYMSELIKGGRVISCDIHPHRVELIKKYAKRMRVDNVSACLFDATKFNKDWEGKFSRVLADVPCSCFGTFLKRPDVFLSRGEEDIKKLAEVQRAIIKNASRYVAKDGVLLYSTCTLFKEENKEAISLLLAEGNFRLEHISAIEDVDGGAYAQNDGSVQILPHAEYDGFYMARLRRIG